MKKINSIFSYTVLIILMFLVPAFSNAQEGTAANVTSSEPVIPFDIDTALFFIALTLAIVILALIGLMRSAIRFHFNSGKMNDGIKFIATGVFISWSASLSYAQSTTAVKAASEPALLTTQSWFLLVIIAVEIYILISMRRWLKYFTGIDAYEAQLAKPEVNLWDKINAFKPMETEASIDTGHNYDGIRELDNITPPWFVAAFIGTIIFAAIYLYRYHVAYSAPNQIKEYEIAMKKAELQQLDYLKHQSNQIDENTVTLLKEGQYEEGKTIYKAACAVCHGAGGQGLVGPNFTDDYWIHGGSVKDIFKTIKYGVLDKGMKSWKDDYSPNQISQLTSYIKSLRGTNPPDQKPPQGNLYSEETVATPVDTAVAKPDTAKTTK